MLPPDDRYKMEWACGAAAVNDWAHPLTTLGAIYARIWLGGGRAALKAASDRMPAPVGRAFMPLVRLLRR